jgi:hypothetical protein
MMLFHLMKLIGKYPSIRIEIPYQPQLNATYVEILLESIGKVKSSKSISVYLRMDLYFHLDTSMNFALKFSMRGSDSVADSMN